jgi:outer membrane receptor protein involved in Fe transport
MTGRTAVITTLWWALAYVALYGWVLTTTVRGNENDANVTELSQITVTAMRTSRSAYDVAGAVSIVTEQDIQRRQPFGSIDVLNDETGVLAQRTTNGQGSPTIRSLTGYHTLLLIDGVRLNNSTFRSGPNQYFSTVGINDLARIEVVRGPNSVLYGNSALGGVVAAYSALPVRDHRAFEFHPRLFARWRSASGDRAGGISVEGGWNELAFRASFARSALGDVRPGKGRDIHVKGRKFILTSEDDDALLPKPKDTIASRGKRYEVTRVYDVEAPTGYTESDGSAMLNWRRGDDETLRFACQGVRQIVPSRWDKIASGEEYSKLSFDPQERHLAYVNYRKSNPVPGVDAITTTFSLHRQTEGSTQLKVGADPSTTTRIEDTVDTVGIAGTASSGIGARNHLSYGAEYYRDAVASKQRLPKSLPWGRYPDGSSAWDANVFAQNESALTSRTTLTVGANATYYALSTDLSSRDATFGTLEKSRSAMAGVASLSYELAPGLRAYGSLGRGFRAPSLDDIAAVQVTNQSISAPSPDVKPEKSLNAEIGLKWNRHRFGGNLTAFQNAMRDQVIWRSVDDVYGSAMPKLYQDLKAQHPEATITVLDNLDRSRIRGVEFDFYVVPLADVTVYGLGSVTRGDALEINGRAPDDAKPWEANIRRESPSSGTVGARWEPRQSPVWMEAFVRASAKQSRLSEGDVADPRIPGYTRKPDEVVWNGRNAVNAGTPGWFTVNLRAGLNLAGATRLTVALENALNRRYRIHGSGVDAPGRNVVVSLDSRL